MRLNRRAGLAVRVGAATLLIGTPACAMDAELPEETRLALTERASGAPAAMQEGKALFEQRCAVCHGTTAEGATDLGPPLAHEVYRPAHHADAAFMLAIQQGVAQHHWRFGHMAAVDGVSPEDAEHIVGYVRWLQRGVGIE